MLAVRQSLGIVELYNDLLKMMVRTGAISVVTFFSVRGSIASGPVVQQPEGVTLQKYPQTRLLLILVEEVV